MATTPFNAVAAAYTNASKLISQSGQAADRPAQATAAQGIDFGKLLGQACRAWWRPARSPRPSLA